MAHYAEPFSIRLVEQRWLGEAETDLCSHGRLAITIGDVVVTDGSEEFGISESALGLLRTLELDRVSASEDARLVMHGCGAILMLGCPVGVDWDVRHRHDGVHISDVIVSDGTSDGGDRRLSVDVIVEEDDYADAVCALADQVTEFFGSRDKRFADQIDRADYEAYWLEFDERLARARARRRRSGAS